tara:strand:- start:13263 stop:14336 length:1074 start_codon:yes stop_codon:yes gene_type:complete
MFEKKYHEAFKKFLYSGQFILGESVSSFEKEFSSYIGSKYAVGVSNCLDGLELLLRSFDIKNGDEVLVPSNTYIATWLAVMNVGAVPIPVEPDINTYNIDPNNIERLITKKTKAIIVVHLYGLTCDMDLIKNIASKYSLYVLEDAAQSHGSQYKKQMAGNLSHGAAFSFFPSKNIGALGDAGIITTNSKQLSNKIKILRNYGSSKKYFNDLVGKNSRLDELQATFLKIRIKTIEDENSRRRILAERYIANLSKSSVKIKLPKIPSLDYLHSWHLFVIIVEKREKLQNYLREKNIDTLIHYPVPPHLQKAFKNTSLANLKLPISEYIHSRCLSLPISCLHTFKEIDYVSEAIIKFFEK